MPNSARSSLNKLSRIYESLKDSSSADAKAETVTELLGKLCQESLNFLRNQCEIVDLTSRVPGKTYFSFKEKRRGKKLSRPVNAELFLADSAAKIERCLIISGFQAVPMPERSKLLYTLAIAYCCAIDLLKTGDQKTPATYFECLVGHLFSRSLDTNPRTQVEVLRLEEEAGTLPTDFIFDLGKGKPKFHVPVKISTRERVIQVFAHQRVLDGVHGFGKFTGILVCLTETKLDHTKREVVEICVPKQWGLYQRFIAPIHRFYYFDVPKKYAELVRADPPMAVKSFAEFFEEN